MSKGSKALWLYGFLLGFGTCFWYIASVGSSWYIAEVVSGSLSHIRHSSVLCIRKVIFSSVYCLGFATLSRLPTALAFPFFLFLIYDRHNSWKPRFKQAAYFFIGIAIPVALYILYNVARYGTILDAGYGLIPGIQQDPFFQQGIFNIAYIPTTSLCNIFPRTQSCLTHFPYFKPSWMGLGFVLYHASLHLHLQRSLEQTKQIFSYSSTYVFFLQ